MLNPCLALLVRCEASAHFLPQLPCCWCSSVNLPRTMTASKRAAVLRAVTAARIVAQGYNLLLLDAETMVLRDPYP